jgi:translation initiation factor IF-2
MANQSIIQRPPIVTVLGHVDHGKTTLLDYIRKTKVASREAGGITQSIGASRVKTKEGKTITFVDTPGHAAFHEMRSRGVKLADIAILVVAADDGVMPQTKEAIDYIKKAKIPFIVALNKVDLATAKPDVTKAQLEKEGVFLEGRGGEVPVVMISAKTGKGVEELLELLYLVAEVNGIKGNKNDPLEALVIETTKDMSGLVVSVVVKSGVLKVGQEISDSKIRAKVRGLFNEEGKRITEVAPGEPAVILGFSELPLIGSTLTLGTLDKKTKSPIAISTPSTPSTGNLPIIVKASHHGVLEAILALVPKEINLISSGVGDVTENDIFVAKASSAKILVFEAKIPGSVRKLSETEGVEIESFRIIYELIKSLEDLVSDKEIKTLGKAKIVAVFPYEKVKRIAGSKMVEGEINKKDKLALIGGENRNENEKGKKIGLVRIVSLRKAKVEVQSVKNGEEFGIYFEPQFDFTIGDVLLSSSKAIES